MVTVDEEQAVSTTTDGPPSPITYEMHPLRKAFKVPIIFQWEEWLTSKLLRTCATSISSESLDIVVGSNTDVAGRWAWNQVSSQNLPGLDTWYGKRRVAGGPCFLLLLKNLVTKIMYKPEKKKNIEGHRGTRLLL